MQSIVLEPCRVLPRTLRTLLPARLLEEMDTLLQGECVPEEIRLRRERCVSLTVSGQNLRLSTVLSGTEMDELLPRLCNGSIYAHEQTICKGYLIPEPGVRVGICGRASTQSDTITAVREISAFVIRIPSPTPAIGTEICALLRQYAMAAGVLLFAPPGVGKTTLLRAVAAGMAGGEEPLRVAVVDTRGELGFSLDSPALLLDVLTGYPRKLGLSIAVRSLSAQLIVCDEIGDLGEAQEILHAHSCGVPLLASAHASNVRELLGRPGMYALHQARCFGAYVRIARCKERFDFTYDIIPWEAADALY